MPTRVASAAPSSGNYTDSSASMTSTTFDVQSGDLIVVKTLQNGSPIPAGGITVTPSASGGSVTWTERVDISPSGQYRAVVGVWTGAVAATATGITVTLDRPTSQVSAWGFSVAVWRNHGGVGSIFSDVTGSLTVAETTATCAAGSALDGMVGDSWPSDGASRVWSSNNGTPITEVDYQYFIYSPTVYEGYHPDVGAAGTKTFGLTDPDMQYSIGAVEILAGGGGGPTNYDGTSTAASTATTTSTGVVGKVATAALAATVAVAATGVVARSTTTTAASTAAVSSTGVVGKSTTTSIASTGTISSTGAVGKVATSTVASTGTVTSAGAVVSGLSASSTIGATTATSSSGVVGTVATSSLSTTGTIAAAGSVLAPGSGTAALASTGTITTAGQVAATSLASITAAAEILAAGAVGVSRTTTLAATATITAAGVVIDPGAIAATPAARTIVIPAESRVLVVPAENRTLEA